MKVSEKLSIRNFYTIKEFDWDIREFNILTGGMGSGKSICVKLLWFLERIFHTLIFYSTITKDDLYNAAFFDKIAQEFNEIFYTGNFDFSATEITYSYSCNGNIFDLRAIWDNDKRHLGWSSEYLNNHLKQWQGFFGKKNTKLDIEIIVYNQIYESILREFHGTFPIGTLFIPDSRAIATITDNTDFLDPFMVRFIKNRKVLVSRYKNLSDKDINKILHIKNIRYDEKQGVIITLPNEGEIPPQYLSSGQQELLYLLLLVKYVKQNPFSFSVRTSIFIEEPEAHLFPQGQKETIEYIVETFRLFKDKEDRKDRFFITTHSPYVLNVMSTMMNRGNLKKKLDELGETSVDSLRYFNQGEVSAYFIGTNGKVDPMISKDETFINAENINDISRAIFDEAGSVDDELADIKARKN